MTLKPYYKSNQKCILLINLECTLLANMSLEMRVCATYNFELNIQFSWISNGFSISLLIQWMQDDIYITKPSIMSFISPLSTQQLE